MGLRSWSTTIARDTSNLTSNRDCVPICHEGDLRWTTASLDQDSTDLPRSRPLPFSDDSKPKSRYKALLLLMTKLDNALPVEDPFVQVCRLRHGRTRQFLVV